MADLSAAGRRASAAKGHALPNGKFPIENVQDLKDAIRLAGHSTTAESTVKAFIKRRAAALGHSDLIPTDWK